MLFHPHQLILILLGTTPIITYHYHYYRLHFIVKETGSEDQRLSIRKGHLLCQPDSSKPHGQSLQLATGPHPGSPSRASNPPQVTALPAWKVSTVAAHPPTLYQPYSASGQNAHCGHILYPTLFHLLLPLTLPSTALFPNPIL